MQNSFTDIFIKRPVLALCVNLLILLAGYQSIRALNVRQFPKSDMAIVTVKTAYIGASAELVRGFITTPLERVIASADGIDYLESASKQGLSEITAHLKLNFDTNAALSQIQAKVAQVRNELPTEAQDPVIDVERSDNRFAAAYLSFYSNDLDQNQITDYLIRVIQPRLSAISGVQKAEVLGARTFAMRIWLKPERLAALGISPQEVWRALEKNNSLSAVGLTKGGLTSTNLIANTNLSSVSEFANLAIRQSGAGIIKLSDIADLDLGAESYEEEVRFDGQKATFIGVWALPSANSLDVIELVNTELADIKSRLPAGMQASIAYDSTSYIRDALHDVTTTLLETIAIVILVIFLFIGSAKAILIPVVAIPLSLIGAAIGMLVFGFSLNLLTLLAIVLAVGLVVDDAIVMLENIERLIKQGLSPFEAAIKGARELVGPTIAMTITLASVYAPIGFQGGLTGTLFKEFAFTLASAVVISGVVALTLSPMMCSKILTTHSSENNLQLKISRFFDAIVRRYSKVLDYVLSNNKLVLSGATFLVLLLFPLYLFSTKELAPREDQGVIFGIVQAAPNATIDQTLQYTDEIQKFYTTVPEYRTSFLLTGASFGFSGILLKPWSERSRNTTEIEGELWGKLSQVPGVRPIVTSPPPLPGGSDFPIEFIISSTDEPQQILEYSQALVGAAFGSGVFIFADSDLKFDQPQAEIKIDHQKVAMLGLDMQSLGNDLGILIGGNYVNRFSIQGRSYKVIPQIQRQARLNASQIADLYVKGPKDQLLPLATFAEVVNSVQPRQLNRFQQVNSAKIQGVLVPGVSIDTGLQALEKAASKILPPRYSIDYAGESRQLRQEGSSLVQTFTLAILVIFLVLAAQFESFRDPLIILLGSVPLALSGSLIFSFLDLTTINIYSQVGLITLVGLVSRNGILIVEFANKLQEQGLDKIQAVREAALTRLRPVLMTSTATVVGHLPLIFASGAGSGARNSIGVMLVSGMLIGTALTLLAIPSLYLLIARVRQIKTKSGLTSKQALQAGVAA